MSVTQPFDFIIQWHLTEKCNLHCRHCYQEGKKVRELPESVINDAIAEIAQMLQAWQEAYDIQFSPSFNVTGGEPFLRKDFDNILAKMAAAGFACYVLSNGTLITAERARKLAALGVAGVQVSLEGPERVHEPIRGRGSFAAALKGVRNLLDAGVKVSLNCTLSQLNADYWEDLVALAASLGVSQMGFSRLAPFGRGAALLDQMLPPARMQEMYAKIFSLQVAGLEIATGDPVAAQMGAPAGDGDAASPLPGAAPRGWRV